MMIIIICKLAIKISDLLQMPVCGFSVHGDICFMRLFKCWTSACWQSKLCVNLSKRSDISSSSSFHWTLIFWAFLIFSHQSNKDLRPEWVWNKKNCTLEPEEPCVDTNVSVAINKSGPLWVSLLLTAEENLMSLMWLNTRERDPTAPTHQETQNKRSCLNVLWARHYRSAAFTWTDAKHFTKYREMKWNACNENVSNCIKWPQGGDRVLYMIWSQLELERLFISFILSTNCNIAQSITNINMYSKYKKPYISSPML